MKYTKDNKVYNSVNWIVLGDRQIFNPTQEQILEAGYTEYIEPTPSEEDAAKAEAEQRIEELKAQLSATDYEAIKYAEGWFTAEEYAETKAARQAMRDEINELQEKLNDYE